MTKRAVTLLLLLLACPLAGLAASKAQALPPMTAETWRADLDFFARELPRRPGSPWCLTTAPSARRTSGRSRSRPDRNGGPTWAGWIAGRDPVLDWIIEQ